MTVLSRSVYVMAVVDALIIAFVTSFTFVSFFNSWFLLALWFVAVTLFILYVKGVYRYKKIAARDLYNIFEGVTVATVIAGTPIFLLSFNIVTVLLLVFNFIGIMGGIFAFRFAYMIFTKLFNKEKNVLIVGAGQDGKLIAEEIQARPELGLRVVGFLDDNMNSIEDEDSTIPILGLTCDSDAVIKDNNVKIVQ